MLRKMSVHPFTGVICCLLLVSWASAVEDDERKLSENDNREKEYFDFYIQESTHSEGGCNMELARMCFLGLSNGSLTAMITTNAEKKKQACEMVWKTKMCLDGGLTSCPEHQGKNKILDPYVPLLVSIARTSCNDGMEEEKDDDKEDDEENDRHDSGAEGCDLDMVGMCLSGFFYAAVGVSSRTSPFTFTDGMCWQAGKSLSCLSATMQKCHHAKFRNLVSMAAAQLKITQEATCKKSEGCNFDRAMASMMAYKNAVDSPLVQMEGSPLSCSILAVTLQMTMDDLKDCPQDVYTMVSGGIYLMSKTTEVVCEGKYPTIEVPPVPMLDEVISLGALVNSPYASKENVCPLFEMAMKKLMTMKSDDVKSMDVMNLMDTSMRMMGELCADQKMWANLMNLTKMNDPLQPCMFKESTMCDLDRARVCVAQSQLDALLGDVEMFGWEPVCHGIERMTRCVQYTINGCKNFSEMTIEKISPKAREVFSLAADHCPVKTLLEVRGSCYPTKCDIQKALSCFSIPTESDITSGQTCSFINKTVSCIDEYTDGCGYLESAHPVNFALKRYLDWLKPYCMDVMVDTVLQMLPECTYKYMEGFNFILTHSTNFTQDFCSLHMHMAKECDDMAELSVFSRYNKAKMYSRGAMISWMCEHKGNIKMMNGTMLKQRMEELSMESRNTPEKEMMQYAMAGSCLTTYLHRLMEFTSLPIPQRKALCSDIDFTKMCVHDNFANATEARQQTAREAMKFVMMIHKQVCPMEMMAMPAMDNTCNVNASLWCLGKLGEYLSSASAFHTQSHCGAVKMAMHCVHNNSMNCTASEKALVKEAMEPILTLTGSACKPETEEECNVTKALIGQYIPETCDQTAVTNCFDWFNKAKDYYILTNNTKALCSMGQQAVMCAQAHSRSCDATFTANSVTAPIETLKADLQSVCREMFSDREASMKDNSTEKCEMAPAVVPCVGNSEMCFNSLVPSEICGNQTSIKACISLLMRGCDKYLVYSYASSLKMNQKSLEDAINSTCDLTPSTTIPSMSSNFSQDMVCMTGNDVFTNYLYNNSATQKDLCKVFMKMSDCIMDNSSVVSLPWRKTLETISQVVKKQVHFRCNVVENLNMAYMDDGKNASEFEIPKNTSCDPMTASLCLYNYAASNVYPAFYPINEREQACRKRRSDITCMQKSLAGCPTAIKMKVFQVLDWYNSIGKSIGICNESPQRKCQPKEAMNCISMLSEGIMAYGMTQQAPAVCSGIVPTEMCVMENTIGCEAVVRASVEDAYRDVSAVAVKTCQMDSKKLMQITISEEMCDMKKAKMCLTGMFDKVAMTTMSMEKVDKKKLCSELHMMAECVEKSNMNCGEMDKMKMAAQKPLIMGLLMGTCSEEEEEETHESGHCKMTAVRCLRDYIQISSMDSLSDYCVQVPPTLKCLASTVTGCSKKMQGLLGMAMDHIEETSGMMCKSKGCNSHLASMCMTEAGAMLKMPPQVFTESPLWCGFVKQALKCAEMHGQSCDMKKNPLSEAWYNSSVWMMQVLCKEGPSPNPVLSVAPAFQLEGLFSLLSLLGNPHSTKETICPHYMHMMMSVYEAAFVLSPEMYAQMIQVYRLPMKTVGYICASEEENYTMSDQKATCDVKAAYKCAEEAEIHSKITSSIFYGWEPVCQSLEKMTCCVQSVTSECMDHDSVLAVTSQFHEIYAAVGDKCSARDISARVMKSCPVPIPKKCEVTNAINNCLLDIRSESDKQQICSKLTEVVKCVKDHTEGCAAAQNAPLEWIVRKYKEWRQSSCDLSRVDTQVMVKDETSESADCYMVFMESVYKGLTSKTDLMEVMCSASEEEEKCLGQVKYIPLPMQFYFTEDVEKYQEFKKMCNKTFTSQPAPSESSACMSDVAAMCLVPYYQGLMNWRLTPMSDRTPMCGLILDVHMCVNISTQTCSKQRQDMFKAGLAAMTAQHTEVCPSILPAMKKMDYVCTPEVASMCIQHYGWYLSEVTSNKQGEACRKFRDTMECVHLSTRNCSDSVKSTFGSSLEQARNMLGDSCPLLSTIMCNTEMWESTLVHSRCNRTKAGHCLMELDQYSKTNMTNMAGMCMKYAATLECVLQNTMTCDPDEVKDINATVHIVMSTLGRECMKLAAEASKTGNTGMEEKSYPLLAALQTCQPRPVCSTRWLDCAPDMNVTVVCNNGEKIAKCMLGRTAGCDNGTKVSIAQDIRMFAMEILRYQKGGKCNFSEIVMEETEPLVPYMHNNTCYLQFSRNFTAVLRNMSSTHWDVCRVLDQTQSCLQKESMNWPALLQGVWKAAAHRIDLNKCYAGYAEAMMKRNMSKEEMKMMAMENWDMSQIYNRTMNESSACQLDLAHNCLQYLGSHAVFGGVSPMMDRRGACRDIAESQKCVVRSTLLCSAKNQMKVLNTAKMFNNLILSQGFCLDSKDVAKDSFRAEVRKLECNEKEAMQCLGMLSLSISQQYYTDSKSAVCSHLLPVEICIAKNTLYCMASVRKSIEATYMDLKTLAKGLCSSQSRMAETKTADEHCLSGMRMKSTVCSVPDALYCINSMHEKIRKMAHNKESVCSMLPELRSCVWKYVGGCKKCQQDSVYWTMHDIYQRLSKVCPTATCDPCTARWCASQLNMTMMKHNMNSMRDNMTMMEDKEVSCVDIWKTRQCMDMSLSGCGMEESHHVREDLEKKMAPMVPKTCQAKLKFTECALHFAVMAQKVIGVSEDMMPKAVLSEVQNMMDAYMKNMTKPPTYEEQLKAVKSLIKIASSMGKSKTCPMESDGWPWGLPEDKPTQCKEAMSAANCMGTHIQQLPKDKIPLVNASLHLIGQLLMDKCDEKPLRCYSCKNAKSNEECNMQPMETCMGPNQMCYTVTTLKPMNGTTNSNRTSNTTRVKRDSHGQDPMSENHGWISKGCTRRVPLLQQNTQCLSGGKCQYGCYKYDCNYMPHSGIRDDMSCDPKMAAICGMHLVSDLLSMKQTDCGKVKEQMRCMYHHTAKCLSSNDQQMYKYALQLASTPQLVQCYAEPEMCKCGRCQLLTYTNLVQNPLLSRDQICLAAYEAQSASLKSVMTQDCTKEDMHNLYDGAKLWGHMLGDMCRPPNIANMLGKEKYNMTCSREAAAMCEKVTPWEHELAEHNDSDVCDMVKKMFYCVHLHTMGCEWTEAEVTNSLAWMASVVTPVKTRCDLSALEKAINATRDSKAPFSADQTKAMFTRVMEEGTEKDKELMYNMKVLQKTLNEVEKQHVCKPSVALHHCFYYVENVAPSDFCRAANKTHACIELMTRDCNLLQKAPVSYVFGNVLSADPRQCGLASRPLDPERAKDPYYQLSACASNYSMAVQRAYGSPSTQTQMMEMCAAAITLDRCVYYTDVSLITKPMLSNMATMTKELMDVSCNLLPMDMTNVKCDEGDVVCMVMKNISKPMEWQDPPTEPSSCEAGYAAACLANYLMRVLTSPFSPLGEHTDVCWERLYMEECVVSKTASCMYNRKQTFLGTVVWFKNITGPGCSVVTKMDTMAVNCSKARECVKTGMYLLTEKESYEDMDAFCWGASQIAKCIEDHAPGCSPQEMVNIREGVEIMGNVTHFYCPQLDASICPLTKMEGTTPGARCKVNNMRMCVTKFYEQTHENAALTDQQFCGILSQSTDCVMRNSSNCHSATINEIKEMMVPGLLMANVNCSVISQTYVSYTTCPIIGNCSVAMAMEKVTQAIAQSMIPGVSACSLYYTLESELYKQTCFPVESAIINKALLQFADYLTAVYNCPKQTTGISQTSGVIFDNSDLAKCTEEVGGTLGNALTNPVYGVWDICQSAMKYHGCLKTLFSKANSTREKFISMTMRQTYMDIESFVNGTCAAMNMTNLKPVTMPAEAAICGKDLAVGCVLSFSMQAMHVGQLRPEDTEKLCRSRMDYFYCMKNASSTCSLGFTSQLQTMLTLADSMLMNSGQCPDDVIEESKRMKEDMWAELIYGQARKDLTINLILGMMEERVQYKPEEDKKEMEDEKEMDENEKEMDKDEEGKDKEEDGKEMDKERMADSQEMKSMEMKKDGCDPRMASRCLMHFSTYLLKGRMSDLADRCRDLVNATPCVWNNVKKCDHTTQYLAMQTMKQVVHYAHEMCMYILPKMIRMDQLPDSKKMDIGRLLMSQDMSESKREEIGEIMHNLNVKEDTMMEKMEGEMEKMEKENKEKKEMMHKMEMVFQSIDHVSEVRERVKAFMAEGREMSDNLEGIMKLLSVAPEDGMCVDPAKYKETGRCDPAMAMECMMSVDRELLNPMSTRDRLCVKHNIATRCYATMSVGCNYITSNMLNVSMNLMMYKVGDKCDLRVASPCQRKMDKQCEVKEAEECLEGLHKVVVAAKDFLPSSANQMCMVAAMSKKCLMEKLAHCDTKTSYGFHDALRPVVKTLDYVCNTMPALGCVTSFLWKTASSVLLSADLSKVGSVLQTMKFYKDQNMTMPDSVSNQLLKEMEDKMNGSRSEAMTMYAGWLGRMVGKAPECMKEEDRKYGMEDVLMSVSTLIKLTMMESGLVHPEKNFVEHVEMLVSMEEEDSVLRMAIGAINRTLMEHRMKLNHSLLIRTAVKEIVQMADSTKMLQFFYAKMTKRMLMKTMEKMGMEMKVDKEAEKEMEMEMQRWMVAEVADKLREMMPNMTKMMTSSDYTMAYLSKSMGIMEMKKWASCSELGETAKCLEMYGHLIPAESRATVNVTMNALFAVVKEVCEPTKCFQCNGLSNNEECNKQGIVTCQPGQGCTTTIMAGKIYKGCAYPGNDYRDENMNYMTCYGSWCNQPMMATHKEKNPMCQPYAAIQCGMDLVPSLVLNRVPNLRDVYKASWCMDAHTSHCVYRHNQAVSQLGQVIKRTALEGTCAGDVSQYECGLRNVMALAATINKPVVSRAALCYDLNATLSLIRTAQAQNKCSEYDSIAVYEGMNTIMQTIGYDYCPGLMIRDNSSCAMMNKMMEGEDREAKCEVEDIDECMEEHELLHMLAMMSDMEKMKAAKEARARDFDQVCIELYLTSQCITSKVKGCSMTVQLDVAANMTQKLAFFIKRCPVSNMMHEMCSPLPMPDPVCDIQKVTATCFGRFNSRNDELCRVDMTDFTSTLTCITNNTSGCSAVQAIPVFDKVFNIIARMTTECSGLTKVLKDDQMLYKMTEEMIAKMIMEYNVMMTMENEKKPMSGVLNTMLTAKYAQKTHNMTPEVVFASMSPVLQNVTLLMEGAVQLSLFGDDTKGVAVCMLDYSAGFRRALMYPDWFSVVFCETITELQSCLSHQKLSPVAQSNVLYILNDMAGDMNLVCENYMEQVMWKGWMLMNLTQRVSSMPIHDKLDELYKNMMNGTQDKMNLTAKDVASMLDASVVSVVDPMLHVNDSCDVYKIADMISEFSVHLVGPFTPKSQYPVLCDMLNNSVKAQLEPLISKCSPAHQMLYKSVMGSIINKTNPICHQPAMNRAVFQPLCKVDEAFGCYMTVFPYLSGKAVPRDKLCGAYHYTTVCVDKHTATCTTDQKASLNYVENYVRSVIGDTCPFVQALRQCYRSDSRYTCSVQGARECIALLGDYSEGITKQTCSKLPQLMQCIGSATAGCSMSDTLDAMSYIEVVMSAYKLLPVCYSYNMSSLLYQSCQAPLTCSLEKAGNCYAPLLTKTSCTVQEASSIRSCASSHLRGCNLIQLQIFDSQLWFGRENMPSCSAFTMDTSIIPSSLSVEAQGLSQCGTAFMKNITTALQTSANSLERICMSMKMIYSECLMKNQTEDGIKFLTAMYGNSFAISVELTDRVCKEVYEGKMPKEEKSSDRTTCDTKIAAQCLSAVSVPILFSASLNREDKRSFCSGETFQACVSVVRATLDGCSMEETEQLRSFHTFLESIKEFSGVCEDHFASCSPMDAMTCSMEAEEKMKMMMERNTTAVRDENPYCSHFKSTMDCVRSNVFGCSKEVKMEVQRSTEEGFCLYSDVLKSCEIMKMKEPKMELPKCMKEKHMAPVCNITTAYSCLKYLYWELESPSVDCNAMHETYTHAMQCYIENVGNCTSGQVMITNHMMSLIHGTVEKLCPTIPGHSCQEPARCEADQAAYCVESLGHLMSSSGNMENGHMCIAVEMTEACVYDKTHHCSMFGKGAVNYAMTEMKNKATETRKLSCTDSLDLCMMKFYYSSLGVLQGEIMMTKLSKMRDHVTSQMMLDMTLGKDPMMSMRQWNMSMDNVSSAIVDSMSKEMQKSMEKTMMDNMTSAEKMIAYDMHILDVMTRGLKSHEDKYLKVKSMQCTGFREAFSCVVNNLQTTSGLRSDVAGLIAGVGSHLYVVVSNMCEKERSCDLGKEPDTCQFLPAATLIMQQAGSYANMKSFCDMLPLTIQNVTTWTQSCMDESMAYHFQKVVSEMKAAKDTMCRSQEACQQNAAQECIANFQSSPSCSSYEVALQCVTEKTKSCDGETIRQVERDLQSEYEKIAAGCVPMPDLVMSINSKAALRLIEGGTEESLNLKLSESPKEKCEAGKTCEVKVTLKLKNNPASTPMCAESQERIPQVVVFKDPSVTDPCTFTFTSDNWEMGTQIPLWASSDMLYDNVQEMNLSLVVDKYSDSQLVLSRQMADIKLVVADTDQPAFCSVSDSYIISFDGKAFKNRHQGEFTLYKHSTMPYEVHILNQACNSRSKTCTCAAMVKFQDDVLVVDVCSKVQSSPLDVPVKLYKNGDLAQGTKIYQDNGGQLIVVDLPTAGLVAIQMENNKQLSVFVIPSSLDWLRSEGLCGVYDANKNNDMAMPVTGSLTNNVAHFIKGWRNKVGDSLYVGALAEPSYQPPMYCSCTGDNSAVKNQCEPMLISKTCKLTSGKDVTAELVELSNSRDGRRKKRAAFNAWEGLTGVDTSYDPQDTELVISASGTWNMTTAGDYCDRLMLSSALMDKCQTLVGTSFTQAMKDICIQTILTNDGTTDVQVESIIKVQCETQLDKMTPTMTTDPNFQTLSSEILTLVCPNDCSNNGQCEGGQCKCYRDYIGADCSIQESAAPSISSLEADGLCSLENGGCKTVLVSGGPFSEELSPKCHFQRAEMSTSGFSATGSVVQSAARFVTSTLLVCTVPDSMSAASGVAVSAVSLSVSNNGQAVSQAKFFISYNPVCYSCDNSGQCTKTSTGCVIGGKCHMASAVNPQSVCEFCDPVTSTAEWTRKIVPGCPGSGSDTTTPSDPNGQGGQGQNKECSTPAPIVEQDKTLAVILGAFAGLFFLTTVVMGCKACRSSGPAKRKLLESDDRASSSAASAIEEKKAPAFVNQTYNDNVKEVVVDPNTSYVYGAVATKTEQKAKGNDPTTLYPEIEDLQNKEN